MSLLSIVVCINAAWVALVHHLIWNTQTYILNLATRVGMNQAKHEDDIEALTTKVATLTEALNKANHVSDVLAQELDSTNQALEESRNEQAMTALQLNQLLGKLDSLQEQVTTLREQRDNETFMVHTHGGHVSKQHIYNILVDTNKLIHWLKQYPCKIKTLTVSKNTWDVALLEYHCDKLNIKVILT